MASKETGPFACEPCKREFKSQQALNVHNARKHSKAKPAAKPAKHATGPHFCPQCGFPLDAFLRAFEVAVRMLAKGAT